MVKEHVYGHHDALNKPLTQLQVLNRRMDTASKDTPLHHITTEDATITHQDISLEFGAIRCGKKILTSKIKIACAKQSLTRGF